MPDKASEDLKTFVSRMGGERELKVEESLGSGFVRLRVAEAERRQARHDIQCCEDVVIELLRNARDASATEIFCAMSREGDTRTIVMVDNGDGVPHELWERIFEARVTSKLETIHMDRWGVHGRGMALYSIKENVQEACVVTSRPGSGTALRIVADASKLNERADQSSWPHLRTDEEGKPFIERGPHNIIRTCCEFALEEQGRCRVFLGSMAEMVATMRRRAAIPSANALFAEDITDLGILERFAVASDAQELAEAAGSCGLPVSERTAHRILSGQISPVSDVLARLKPEPKAGRKRAVNLERDRRGLRIAHDDMQRFTTRLEQDFEMLSERYYLTLTDVPRVRVGGGRITVTFEFSEED